MKSSSVLIVGCGDLGTRSGRLLLQKQWQVTGVRRDTTKLPAEFAAREADYTRPGSLDFASQLRPDYVVATFNPLERSVEGYNKGFQVAMRNLLQGLGQHRPRHIIMASSTRVFAEAQGGWVDEDSSLSRDDPRALAIIDAERQLLDSDHSASVVRFAGIYGIPGGRLLARISRGELCAAEPTRYTNRIHRDDCAGFLVHLLQTDQDGGELAPVYIGVDDNPAAQYEVETWLARKLGVDHCDQGSPPPREQPVGHNTAGHKRCRNRALRDSGYQLLYPEYRSGYGALLD